MIRWLGLLVFAGTALAQGNRPIDALPWNASLGDALDEAEERGAPLAVYVCRAGEEGEAPQAIGASEATKALYAWALWRIDLSKASDDRASFEKRWGDACDLSQLPAVHLFDAKAQWRAQVVQPAADGKGLAETLEAVATQNGGMGIEAGYYRNARAAWRRASAAGDAKAALADLDVVVGIAENCKKDFRFTAEARTKLAELVKAAKERLDELKKASAAKDWRRVWDLGHELMESYAGTALGNDVEECLAEVEKDPEADKALSAFAAAEDSAKRDAHRAEALAALRARVPASEAPDDKVTVVFWDQGFSSPEGEVSSSGSVPEDPVWPIVAGGFWLGDDRCVVFAWDAKARKVLERKGEEGMALEFLDLHARDDVERKVLSVMREKARWEDRPVVPVAIKPGDNGKLLVTAYDGWDADCGHWSSGTWAVDVTAGTVEDRGHVK